jgi:hypothetical protein
MARRWGVPSLFAAWRDGSGKTAVYLAAMQRALDRGLVVDSAGAGDWADAADGGAAGPGVRAKVALLHSALTPEERSEQWRRIRAAMRRLWWARGRRSLRPRPIWADSGGRGARPELQAGGDAALQRARCGRDARQAGRARWWCWARPRRRWRAGRTRRRASTQRIEMRDRVMNRPLPEVELIDMRRSFRRRAGAAFFARAGRADAAGAGPRRAGADSAQPARLLVCRDLPRLRRKAGVPELRHFADAPQAAGGRRRTDLARGAATAAGVPLLRLRRTVPARCPKCDSEHLYYLGAGSQQGEERLGGDLSQRAHRAHGSRHGARALRSGAAAGAAAFGRDQPAGGHADDRQGPRHSRHHAGGRGGLRPRALDAGLSRRRAGLSADDAGLRPRRGGRACRGAWWCRPTIPTTTRFWPPASTTTRALWSAS